MGGFQVWVGFPSQGTYRRPSIHSPLSHQCLSFSLSKSIEYILCASSSFKSRIILMGWGRGGKGRVQQQNCSMGQWWGTCAAPSSESQSWTPVAAFLLLPLPPQLPLSTPGTPSSSANPQPPESDCPTPDSSRAQGWLGYCPLLGKYCSSPGPWLSVAVGCAT